MTLPVERYVDVHVTGSELIGVVSDEPLRVLRMNGISESNDDNGNDDDCSIEFEVVEPFQPQSTIQAFTSVLDGRGATQTTVWLLIDANLLKSDKLNVDETDLLDSQFTDGESLEILGRNYTAVRLMLTQGFHVVAAVTGGSDVAPQLDLFQYIYVPGGGQGHLQPCLTEVLCGRSPSTPELPTAKATLPQSGGISSLIDSYSSDVRLSTAWRGHNRSAERIGGESALEINAVLATIDTNDRSSTNRRTTTQTASDQRELNNDQVTDTHQRDS